MSEEYNDELAKEEERLLSSSEFNPGDIVTLKRQRIEKFPEFIGTFFIIADKFIAEKNGRRAVGYLIEPRLPKKTSLHKMINHFLKDPNLIFFTEDFNMEILHESGQ